MDLYKLIPNSDKNWKVKKNRLYYHYICDLLVFYEEGDVNWICLDISIAKQITKLVKHLSENDIDFFFRCPTTFTKHKYTEDEFNYLNLKAYINIITYNLFYDRLASINYNYTKNLGNYIVKFNAHDVFKNVYKTESVKLLGKNHDFFQDRYYYKIGREDIRDYISCLEREIKLNMII